MMFTVLWSTAAEQELTRLWLAARDRTALSEAAAEIDRVLATRPQEAGESREGRNRLLFVWPLVVFYAVDVQNRRVIVRRIRRM